MRALSRTAAHDPEGVGRRLRVAASITSFRRKNHFFPEEEEVAGEILAQVDTWFVKNIFKLVSGVTEKLAPAENRMPSAT
jgi:hypothetical protein